MLVGAIILAALVGSFIVMFHNIKEMLLTNHTSGGEIGFLYVLGILAVAIILLIVVCVLIGGAIKKSDVGVEIDGGIAVCGCGREFAFGDLSWRVGQTRRETRSNDDSSRTTYETIGSIFIEAKCKKCGKVSKVKALLKTLYSTVASALQSTVFGTIRMLLRQRVARRVATK